MSLKPLKKLCEPHFQLHQMMQLVLMGKTFTLCLFASQENIKLPWEEVHTVIQNEYYTSRLVVFRFVHLNHLPKEKMTQMRYHLKALI